MIPKIKRPEDPGKINLKNPYEVNWWCVEFGVTNQRLLQAIREVGISSVNVKDRLFQDVYS